MKMWAIKIFPKLLTQGLDLEALESSNTNFPSHLFHGWTLSSSNNNFIVMSMKQENVSTKQYIIHRHFHHDWDLIETLCCDRRRMTREEKRENWFFHHQYIGESERVWRRDLSVTCNATMCRGGKVCESERENHVENSYIFGRVGSALPSTPLSPLSCNIQRQHRSLDRRAVYKNISKMVFVNSWIAQLKLIQTRWRNVRIFQWKKK